MKPRLRHETAIFNMCENALDKQVLVFCFCKIVSDFHTFALKILKLSNSRTSAPLVKVNSTYMKRKV